ncbi:MAG: hypothetical protein LC117_10950 [Bacteroidia bacterium]|nr:hypothetical protein [Bacteroidia bacterium]MCZ2278434.1 hypothetical protein [Bacteroidia bacterium]
MAINKNHEFGDLDGVKCSIVEKDIPIDRAHFLKNLLDANGYKTVLIKAVAPNTAKAANTETSTESDLPAKAEKFTLGVTDLSFNAVNAVFGRLLRTSSGKVVTLSFWNQEDSFSDDSIPYFSK